MLRSIRSFSPRVFARTAVTVVTSTEHFDTLCKQNAKVVVDFGAVWCGPCKMIEPTFKDMSNGTQDVAFLKVDIDNEECGELCERFGITGVPHFVACNNGNTVGKLTGANIAGLQSLVENLKTL
eukprot:TRINITY_DN3160_c0_g1_i1.p1 TRINITY_DN3160_c0_g1~~TRINITY_DN3160_c0_g1_i1.p1  ORF type:complete len:124 (+),score=37.02 TRINITY_DN3160_c0_g1_i1:49-420(+)